MKSGYPNSFHRGISSPGFIDEGKYVNVQAFSFDKYDPNRKDGFRELSINWHDSDESIRITLSQHKPYKSEPQFKVGFCSINLSEVEMCLKVFISDGFFDYERSPVVGCADEDVDDNPFHGNLLVKESTPAHIYDSIKNTLAVLANNCGSITFRVEVCNEIAE